MYDVFLNDMVRVLFVPPFSWEPWPPTMPPDIDIASSAEEARRVNGALAGYVVTPLAARAGEESAVPGFPSDDGSAKAVIVFYVQPDEFAAILVELQRLAESLDRSNPVRVSMLEGSHLAKLLLSRVVVSPRFHPGHRWIVGRGPRPESWD
jgi:hypothetical protein